MPGPVNKERVPVWESLNSGDKLERFAGQFVGSNLPDNGIVGIDLEYLLAMPAGNQNVSIFEKLRLKRTKNIVYGANDSAVRVQFAHLIL